MGRYSIYIYWVWPFYSYAGGGNCQAMNTAWAHSWRIRSSSGKTHTKPDAKEGRKSPLGHFPCGACALAQIIHSTQ